MSYAKKISKRKDEPKWMTEWRLSAYKVWKEMDEPNWANVKYNKQLAGDPKEN